jgi:hypothetical protein
VVVQVTNQRFEVVGPHRQRAWKCSGSVEATSRGCVGAQHLSPAEPAREPLRSRTHPGRRQAGRGGPSCDMQRGRRSPFPSRRPSKSGIARAEWSNDANKANAKKPAERPKPSHCARRRSRSRPSDSSTALAYMPLGSTSPYPATSGRLPIAQRESRSIESGDARMPAVPFDRRLHA